MDAQNQIRLLALMDLPFSLIADLMLLVPTFFWWWLG
jgi:hypothetical protein